VPEVTKLRTIRRHIRGGRHLPPLSRLDLPEEEARRFIERGIARIERDDERDDVDPGIECWGLRALKSGLIARVLAELEIATEYACDDATLPGQDQYLKRAMLHCLEAWRSVGALELKCRDFLGSRPTEREILVNPSPTMVALGRRRIGHERCFAVIRERVALAQNALNAAIYPDLRLGKKKGARSIAWYVLRAIALESDSAIDISTVSAKLVDAAVHRRLIEGAAVEAIGDDSNRPEAFVFRKDKRDQRCTRRNIEVLLVEIRKSLDSTVRILSRLPN
jgi:hypothetical protein